MTLYLKRIKVHITLPPDVHHALFPEIFTAFSANLHDTICPEIKLAACAVLGLELLVMDEDAASSIVLEV